MQTFICWHNFYVTATYLDNKRLGKQRAEALQILNTLAGKSKGWRNHPATLMWYGHESCLKLYHDTMIAEWLSRGFKNSMPLLYINSPEHPPYGAITPDDLKGLCAFHFQRCVHIEGFFPAWYADLAVFDKVVESHRSNLYRKDPVHYQDFVHDGPTIPYYWPVTKEEVEEKRALSSVLAFCS